MKAGSAASCVQALAPDQAQEPDRVVEGQLPDLRVHPAEQVPGAVVPRPAQVERQLLQGAQRLGEAGPDGEAPECPHGVEATGRSRPRTSDAGSVRDRAVEAG